MHVIGTIASSQLVATTAFESIATATGTGSSGTITFSSIPSTYKHLQIRAVVRTTDFATGGVDVFLQFNGVTTSSYAYQNLSGINPGGGTPLSNGSITQPQILTFRGLRNSNLSGTLGVGVCDIFDYASTSKTKSVSCFTGYDYNGTGWVGLKSGFLNSTSAVSSITLSVSGTSFSSVSSFALYGIKG